MKVCTHQGREYSVVASFTGKDRAQEAAEYIRTHLHAKILHDIEGETLIVSDSDMGKPVDAADSDFGGAGWTSMYESALAHSEANRYPRLASMSMKSVAELRAGADEVRNLMAALQAIGDGTVSSLDSEDNDGADGRDYVALVAALDQTLRRIASEPGPRRQGALRALVDLLTPLAEDGACGPSWDPLMRTEGAFARVRYANTGRGESSS